MILHKNMITINVHVNLLCVNELREKFRKKIFINTDNCLHISSLNKYKCLN